VCSSDLIAWGGDQLLLQGGHHPELGLDFYANLFKQIKAEFPDIKLHTLGPPEIAHIAKIGGHTHTHVLKTLKEAGMNSLPGAGAEILVDRVRKLVSNGKCGAQEWLDVMAAAHQLNITSSATMMFGHVETLAERLVEGAPETKQVSVEIATHRLNYRALTLKLQPEICQCH
jgi:cyclic dehypoxanthinyl futalosine synthase